jgi:orotidine-5'-phosphate decarboxylase
LEIFVREGPQLIEEIQAKDQKIFLDLKLHDIPNTVGGAVRSACRLGIDMLTVHAAGGRRMLEAACEAAQTSPSPPLLLAVTALTSLSPEDARSIGVQDTISIWVERLATLAQRTGVPGLVASPQELPLLRQNLAGSTKIVTPGIRPAGAPSQDQARTSDPGSAIRAGADFLVVGRPILQAPDPAKAADLIVMEIDAALQFSVNNP